LVQAGHTCRGSQHQHKVGKQAQVAHVKASTGMILLIFVLLQALLLVLVQLKSSATCTGVLY
jgi:hypothetical protein